MFDAVRTMSDTPSTMFGLLKTMLEALSGEYLATSVLVAVIGACVVLRQKNNRPPGSRPLPGPRGYPLVGNIPQLGSRPYKAFQQMWTRHGDVFQVRLLSTPVVVLNGQGAIREAFIGQGFVFASRPSFPSWGRIANGHSLTFSPFSESWRAHKKMSGHALFLLNANPSKPVDELISRHGDALVVRLQGEQVTDPLKAITGCVGDIIFPMLFGEASEHGVHRKQVLSLLDDFREMFDEMQIADAMPNFAKIFLRHTVRKCATVCKGIDQAFESMLKIYMSQCDGSLSTTAAAFLKVSSQIPDEGLPNGLKREQVIDSLQDIVGAALETTIHTLYFSIRYLLQYPEVQMRAQAEMDELLGELPVTWEHRSRLPFVRACISEILRHSSVLPLTIPHATTQDTVFRGYFIPKGTMVFGNIYSASYDPEVWDSPEDFCPDRFIAPDGSFNKSLMSKLCMFGLGKRRCLGEAIANKMVFIIFAKLLQQCTFSADSEISTDTIFALSLRPTPFTTRVEKRTPHSL